MSDPGGRVGQRGKRRPVPLIFSVLFLCALSVALFVFFEPARAVLPELPSDPPELRSEENYNQSDSDLEEYDDVKESTIENDGETEGEIEGTEVEETGTKSGSCATVEEMGDAFVKGSDKESLRVRKLIEGHFQFYGIFLVSHLSTGVDADDSSHPHSHVQTRSG